MWSYARFAYLARIHQVYEHFLVYDYTYHNHEDLMEMMFAAEKS